MLKLTFKVVQITFCDSRRCPGCCRTRSCTCSGFSDQPASGERPPPSGFPDSPPCTSGSPPQSQLSSR